MTHRFDLRVYYEDTDLAGIVYYANYSNPLNQEDDRRYAIVGLSRIKKVADIMEAAYPVPGRGPRRAAEPGAEYESMSPEQLIRKAAQLEKQMLRAAKDLEFEEAARVRDEIHRLKEQVLKSA